MNAINNKASFHFQGKEDGWLNDLANHGIIFYVIR
jgi:hypothetical protein